MKRFLALFVIGVALTLTPTMVHPAHAVGIFLADFVGDGVDGTVMGRFTFTHLEGNKCRVTGQFNDGFEDSDIGNYNLLIENSDGSVFYDMTPDFQKQVTVNVPGTSPFQQDYDIGVFNCDGLGTKHFLVQHKGSTIGSTTVLGV